MAKEPTGIPIATLNNRMTGMAFGWIGSMAALGVA
jgi:hypothetical protein